MRSFVGILSFLVFLALIAWAGGIWVSEFQKKMAGNCSDTEATLGLCK